MNVLKLHDLSRSFGSVTVLQGVSLDIKHGEILGVIGPNGAGKTTLFNLISGDLFPDAGTVSLLGRDVTRLPARARAPLGVARTYQIPRPFLNMTVKDNLMVGATHAGGLGLTAARQKADEVLQLTGLAHLADRPARETLLLDRKRLELARALATRPKLLLLDEIAGGLSDRECDPLIDILRKVHATGVTIIWIEHVLHALVQLAERIVVLDAGELVADGPMAEIMASDQLRDMYLGPDHQMLDHQRAGA